MQAEMLPREDHDGSPGSIEDCEQVFNFYKNGGPCRAAPAVCFPSVYRPYNSVERSESGYTRVEHNQVAGDRRNATPE